MTMTASTLDSERSANVTVKLAASDRKRIQSLAISKKRTPHYLMKEAIQAYLERFLHEVVLPGRTPRIEHRWAGIMAFGRERLPILERLSPHLAVGVRMSGMGIAIGSRVGDRLADLLLQAF